MRPLPHNRPIASRREAGTRSLELSTGFHELCRAFHEPSKLHTLVRKCPQANWAHARPRRRRQSRQPPLHCRLCPARVWPAWRGCRRPCSRHRRWYAATPPGCADPRATLSSWAAAAHGMSRVAAVRVCSSRRQYVGVVGTPRVHDRRGGRRERRTPNLGAEPNPLAAAKSLGRERPGDANMRCRLRASRAQSPIRRKRRWSLRRGARAGNRGATPSEPAQGESNWRVGSEGHGFARLPAQTRSHAGAFAIPRPACPMRRRARDESPRPDRRVSSLRHFGD